MTGVKSYRRLLLLFAYDGGLQPAFVLGLALVPLLQHVLEHKCFVTTKHSCDQNDFTKTCKGRCGKVAVFALGLCSGVDQSHIRNVQSQG